MREGDRVKNIYDSKEGTVVRVWDGKFIDTISGKEDFNPYCVMVQVDGEDCPDSFKPQHLAIQSNRRRE